jgi:AcrR family transcriptional regulator
MPKKPRPQKEVEAFKEEIVGHAVELIREHGMEGLTMRRLADRLGVRAVTIYSYYESKDHLYLAVLTKGFQLLYDDCRAAYNSETGALARLEAMMRAYLDFGVHKSNFYNLMFTWHVPKYRDYVDTPMEPAARHELFESQKVYLFFIEAVKELAESVRPITDDEARQLIIYFWSTLHGYIAGNNNNLLNYMHESPGDLKEIILENLFRHMRRVLEEAASSHDRDNRREKA